MRGYHLFDNLPLGDAPHEPTAQNSKRCGCSTRRLAGWKTTPDLAGEPPIFVVESKPRFGFFRNTVNAGFVSGQIIIFQNLKEGLKVGMWVIKPQSQHIPTIILWSVRSTSHAKKALSHVISRRICRITREWLVLHPEIVE